MRARSFLFTGGVLAGLSAGWVLGQQHLRTQRSALFSPSPVRRHAALGYLAGREDIETARLLRDYLAWERTPMLRRRALAILRRLEATLA
ncbi:MAG: hypothetical protein AB7I33_14930 [Gemmatimonadales bacterium]